MVDFIRKGLAACCAALLLALAVQPAQAELRLDITSGNVEPLPIGFVRFSGEGFEAAQISRMAAEVMANNLVNTGLFRRIEPLEGASITTAGGDADYAAWRRFGADALVVGEVAYYEEDDSFEIAFRLIDLQTGNQITAFNYLAAKSNARRVAHLMSDAIYHRVTGESGYFDSRIVFIEETGSKVGRAKSLVLMDQDGHNLQSLVPGKEGDIIITPRFSPVAQEITYVSYEDNDSPGVFIYNLETGQRERVQGLDAMSFAPRFSPDGKSLVMSLERGGNANLFKLDTKSGKTQAISNSPSIDTSPSYSPDGKFITFESDRGGSQQIYVMRADGTRPRRISSGDGAYGTPIWSPRGDLIAFTKQRHGKFYIGVMRIDGAGERILTENYHNEAPVWSPNGRILLFFRETPGEEGGPHLWSIDLTGQNEKKISTPAFASDPAWSPPLPPPARLR